MHLSSAGSVRVVPLQSRWALATGGAVGATVGGAFALALQGISNAGPGTLFGVLLGVAWTGVQQYLDVRERQPIVRAHERPLRDYPEVRELLQRAGRTHHDADAVRQLAVQLSERMACITTHFNAYCAFRRVTPHALIGPVIRHFFLSHCGHRGVVLISKRSMQACYLVAAHTGDKDRIVAALNDATVPAGTALRQLRCPYMRLDLANEELGSARECITEEGKDEWRVRPVWSDGRVETLAPEPIQPLPQRRHGRRVVPVQADASAAPVVSRTPLTVSRSQTLCGKLAELPADSRTWRELKRIEEDLAANRPCGHLVNYRGVEYTAIDIHWDQDLGRGGRQSAGRNVWRLLVKRTDSGHLLVDIVNYHR